MSTTYLWNKYKVVKNFYGSQGSLLEESKAVSLNNASYDYTISETGVFSLVNPREIKLEDAYISGKKIYLKYKVPTVIIVTVGTGDYSHPYKEYAFDIKSSQSKGEFISVETSENRNAYPDDSIKGGYWYVYQGISNHPPTISGEDTNLGEKNQPFEISYKVEDKDITDNVTVTEYLNNRQIRRITNANNTNQTLKITSKLLNSCSLGETNTIKIYAEDEKGAGTYRNYWFTRTNTPPYFAEENTDLGTISKAPTITFTAKDDDGDKYLKAKVKINQRVVKVYDQLGNGEQVSFTLDWKDFMQLHHSRKHNLWVEIEDSLGALATLKYTFERDVNSIEIVTNTAPLDIKIKLIVFNANIKLGEGATFLQYACNDFGTGNTWEEIQNGVPFAFENIHEGEDVIGYKCELTKGTGESEIRSIGGSFI